MATLTVEEAQGRLAQIIDALRPGDELVLTRDDRPIARLTREGRRPRPGPGLGKGMFTVVADDDEHLKDFAEYMP